MKPETCCLAVRPAAARPRRRARGLSLIEMLTTMSTLAVLLAVGTPGLASLSAANSMSAAENEFAAALTLARTEAVRRGVATGVAALAPQTGTEFNGGWVVFIDSNGNGRYDAGEEIVRTHAPLTAGVRIATATGVTSVAFNPRGFLVPSTLVDLTVCPAASGAANSKGYRVRVEPVGLADVATITSCS